MVYCHHPDFDGNTVSSYLTGVVVCSTTGQVVQQELCSLSFAFDTEPLVGNADII